MKYLSRADMLTAGAVIATLFLHISPQLKASSDSISAAEASAHVGELISVCGKVVSTNYAKGTRGQPTFINLDKPYPNQVFTVVIWGSDRPAFGNPETLFSGKRICASGVIQLYKSKPEIIAKKPSQIRIESNP